MLWVMSASPRPTTIISKPLRQGESPVTTVFAEPIRKGAMVLMTNEMMTARYSVAKKKGAIGMNAPNAGCYRSYRG